MLSLQRLKREIVRFATQQSINSIQTAGSIAQNGLQVLGSIQVGYTRKYSALYLQGKYYTDWARPGSSRTCSRRDPGSRRAHGNKGIDSPLCNYMCCVFSELRTYRAGVLPRPGRDRSAGSTLWTGKLGYLLN